MTLCNLLRVPPIFIMDELFKSSFGLPEFADILFPANNILTSSTDSQIQIEESAQYYKAILLSFIKIIVSCISKLKSMFLKIKISIHLSINPYFFQYFFHRQVYLFYQLDICT